MTHPAGADAPTMPDMSGPVIFILETALRGLEKLTPATMNAILRKLDVSNPMVPNRMGYVKALFMMLLADFKTGWLTVENVSVQRLQAVALALGLNPGNTWDDVMNVLQAFALSALQGGPPPPTAEARTPEVSSARNANGPTTEAPASPSGSPYKVLAWGNHKAQAILVPLEPGVEPKPITRKVTAAQRGHLNLLAQELAAKRLTRAQYDDQCARIFTDGKFTATKTPATGADPTLGTVAAALAANVAPPRFARLPAPATLRPSGSGSQHPALGPNVTEPPPLEYSPGHIPLNPENPDPCPWLAQGSKEAPPGPRMNEHPPQPFTEPPQFGAPGIPEVPKPPPPRLMAYKAPPLTSGQPFSPPEGETVMKYTYNFVSGKWYKRRIRVRLDLHPFQEGSMRWVFHMKDLSQPVGPLQDYVAKISKDVDETPESYFQDCEMQALAGYYAEEYCQFGAPKRAQYIEASVIECVDRRSPKQGAKVLFGVEPLVYGAFIKYTNNYGWVNSEAPRHTPQAFSHFTWCYSRGTLLVADVQGVTDNMEIDRYTDPQVLTAGGVPFGRADLQLEGIKKFFETHVCNDVCHMLRLPEGIKGSEAYIPPPRKALTDADASGPPMSSPRQPPARPPLAPHKPTAQPIPPVPIPVPVHSAPATPFRPSAPFLTTATASRSPSPGVYSAASPWAQQVVPSAAFAASVPPPATAYTRQTHTAAPAAYLRPSVPSAPSGVTWSTTARPIAMSTAIPSTPYVSSTTYGVPSYGVSSYVPSPGFSRSAGPVGLRPSPTSSAPFRPSPFGAASVPYMGSFPPATSMRGPYVL